MRINEIAPPGREKQVKKLKKKFDDPGAPYAIAWAQHNKHGKPSKKESINFNSEHDEVKAILDKHGITKSDDIEYGSAVYQDLFDYFANSGEMPYGVMKARDGDPDQWIADRLDDLGLVEIADVPTQKGRDAKPNVLTPRAMNVVKKQIKKDANKQRRADSKKAVDTDESTDQVAGIGHQGLNFKFKVSDLINHAKQYPVKQIDPNLFKDQLAGRQEDPTKSGERAANANLSYPIIAVKFNDGSLMVADGTHRVQKAIGMGQKINARIIPVSDMQKFRVANLSDNPTQSTQQKGKQPKVDTTGSDLAARTPSVAQAFAKGYSGESVEEAPFGKAVKSAIGRVARRTATAVKKKVGAVPGLGGLKTSAQAQQSVDDVSDQVWNSYLKFKATNPDEEQKIAWFRKNHQMDVKATIDNNGDITRDEVEAGVKSSLAQQQSGKVGTPTTDQQDRKDVQVKLDLLKKSDPTATVTTLVALKKFAQDGKLDPTRQQALQPLVAKIANALNNPGKANILARALQESLSSSDLSKLDMLAREGLVNKNKVSRFKTAMRMLAKDKDLPISYKDDVIEVVSKLAKIITKPSVMGMVRKGLKENQTTKTAQEQFKTWVNQANDIIS